MSEHTMLVRCIHCGTDKPPLRNESEHKDTEPWRCSECGESGVKEDFYILESIIPMPPVVVDWAKQVERTHRFMENYSTDIGALLKQEKEKGRQAGIKEEREATIRYFKRIGKPYYVALFREGEHLK